MQDKSSLHLKVQELCDCYATNDPLEEMSRLANDENKEEAALKWIALAALHAVNAGAKKITLSVDDNGEVKATAKYREAVLPSPGQEIGRKIIEDVRAIMHFEKGKQKGPLALGIRNDSLEIGVSASKDKHEEEIELKFPG